MIEQETAVKEEGWLEHVVVDGLVIVLFKLIPLGEDDDRVGTMRCFVGRLLHMHQLRH